MSDFNRRDILKGTVTAGLATGAGATMTGVAAADNGTEDVRDYTIRVYTDNSSTNDDNFQDGVLDGLNDLADWIDQWMGYSTSCNVYDNRYLDSDIGPVREMDLHNNSSDHYMGEFDHLRSDIPNYALGAGDIAVVITSQSDRKAGRCDLRSHLFTDDGESTIGGGIVCYVNEQHTGYDKLTGSDYGYNFAVHEVCHGFNAEPGSSGAKHYHGDPEFQTSYYSEKQPTIMATGYATTYKDSSAVPDTSCFNDWNQTGLYPSPTPRFTMCTAKAIGDYFFGGEGPDLGNYKPYIDLSENEKPW